MATKIAAKKTLAKKTTTKEKIVPLTQYNGYNIARDGHYVEFGCGAVCVLKSDLVKVGKFLSKVESLPGYKEYKQSLTELTEQYAEGYDDDMRESDVINIGGKTLLQIAG